MLHITIPLDPRTKKNSQNIFVSRKTGKRFISTSKSYKEYVNDCFFLIRENDKELKFPISGPVNINAQFYMAARRRVDLPNLLECLDDVLVTFGVLVDDNCTIVVSHDGSRVHHCKENPRTEVYIEKTSPNNSMTPKHKK
jgi:Holliday junction resolvase RusA-like endonuclease